MNTSQQFTNGALALLLVAIIGISSSLAYQSGREMDLFNSSKSNMEENSKYENKDIMHKNETQEQHKEQKLERNSQREARVDSERYKDRDEMDEDERDERREEQRSERNSDREARVGSEKYKEKVQGRENGNGEKRNTQRRENFDREVKKASKYQKFSGALREKKSFSDDYRIKNKDAVAFLQQRGILDGYADGSFQPEASINRAESLKVLLEALGQKPSSGELGRDFSDVNQDDWFAGYVKKSKRKRDCKRIF